MLVHGSHLCSIIDTDYQTWPCAIERNSWIPILLSEALGGSSEITECGHVSNGADILNNGYDIFYPTCHELQYTIQCIFYDIVQFLNTPPPQVYIPDLYRSDSTEHHKMTSISVVTEKNLTHFKMELGLYFKILTGLTKKSKKKKIIV